MFHLCDLATGAWSRHGGSAVQGSSTYVSACYDAPRNRWYKWVNAGHTLKKIDYFDGATKDWLQSAEWPGWPPNICERGAICMYQGYLICQGRRAHGNFWALLDPDNLAAGWVSLTFSGTIGGSDEEEYAFFPPTGKYYNMPKAGGSTLHRVTPPASSPKTNTWTADTVTLNQSVPQRTTQSGQQTHQRGLVYVPSIERLAWFPGGSESVYLINPTS